MYEQFKNIMKLGPISQVMGKIPGLSSVFGQAGKRSDDLPWYVAPRSGLRKNVFGKSRKETAYAEFKDYMDNATIAGTRFITEDGVHLIGRVLWVIFEILSFAFFLYMLQPLLEKYFESPIMIRVETTNYNIANIKFPGVTVCSNFRISKKNFEKRIKEDPWRNYDPYDVQQLVTNLVKFETDPDLVYKTEGSEKIMRQEDVNISSFMAQIVPSCDRMFLYCEWQGKRVECKDFIRMRKTDSGFCCSFNTINIADNFDKDPSSEGGYEDNYSNWMDNYNNYYGYNNTGIYTQSNYTQSNYTQSNYTQSNYTQSNSSTEYTTSNGEDSTITPADSQTSPPLRYEGIIAGYENDPDNMCLNKTKPQKPESNAYAIPLMAPTTKPMNVTKKENVIYHTNLAGPNLGFSFVLDHNFADEFVNVWKEHTSTNFFTGFKVLIHSPDEFPEVSTKSIPINEGTETFIALSAHVTKSTESVQSMSPTRRNCLLEEEINVPELDVNLNVFKSYSQANCLLECRAAATLKLCNCLMYYYPQFPKRFIDAYPTEGNNTACTVDQLMCLIKEAGRLRANVGKTKDIVDEHPGVLDGINCDCPDDCDQTLYTQEITSVAFVDNNNALSKKILGFCSGSEINYWNCTASNEIYKQEYEAFYKYYAGDDCVRETFKKKALKNSLVHVFFKQVGVTLYAKDELMGWVEILGLVGGTFGLCNGFCLLSGMEVLYYIFLHRYLKKED